MPTALAVATALALGACTVGPDFRAPQPDVPAQWHDSEHAHAGTAASDADAALRASGHPGGTVSHAPASTPDLQADPDPRWWKSFGDPELDSLVARAAAGNPSLQQAVLRIAEARLQAQATAAQGLPNVRASASYQREQLGVKGFLQSKGVYDQVDRLGAPDSPVNQFAPGMGATVQNGANNLLSQLTAPVNLWQSGFDASWELDLFGRVRRSVEAANAQAEASAESRNDALLSLEAEVAQTYLQLRGAQQLRAVTNDLVAQQRDVVNLTQSQAKVGMTSVLNLKSATAQLAQTSAQLPQYDQQIAESMNALAYLVGAAPGALDAELEKPAALPAVPPTVLVGLPSTLARRRPDVRRAEANLHAAIAGVGVAVAQFYPDISLSGQIGTRATNASDLSRWSHLFYSFGPSVSLPIFEGGQLVSNLKISKLRGAEAALAYRDAVLVALRDVDNALVVYRTDQERRNALDDSVAAQQSAFELARDSYRKGLVSFIDVLDAERQLSEARQADAQGAVQVDTDLVALYKALGGGWQQTASAGDSAGTTDASGTPQAAATASEATTRARAAP